MSKNSSGFVALLAVMSISLVLLVLTIELGLSGWYRRFGVLEGEWKAASRTLAASCVEAAIMSVVASPFYQGNATTSTPTGTCYTFPISEAGVGETTVTVTVRAVVERSVTTWIAEYDIHDIRRETTPDIFPPTGMEDTTVTRLRSYEIP